MMTMPEGSCWKEMLQSSFGFESLLCKLKQCRHSVSLTWLLQGNCLKCSIEVGRSEMNLLARHSNSSVTTVLDLPPPLLFPVLHRERISKRTKKGSGIIYFTFKLFKTTFTLFMPGVFHDCLSTNESLHSVFQALLKVNLPLLHLGCRDK